MQPAFSTQECKDDFLSTLKNVKGILSRKKKRQLDNVELLQALFDLVKIEADCEMNHSNADTACEESSQRHVIQPMLENSGKQIITPSLLYDHIISLFVGVYCSNDDTESDTMFVAELKTLRDLSTRLTDICKCGSIC
jgi:hypothetical protein